MLVFVFFGEIPWQKTVFKGVVDRAGPLLVADDYGTRITGYAVRLEGDPNIFHVLPRGFSLEFFPFILRPCS